VETKVEVELRDDKLWIQYQRNNILRAKHGLCFSLKRSVQDQQGVRVLAEGQEPTHLDRS
jgi:hypothetical protein